MFAEEYSMLILAGGKSRRMGKDKAELLLEGIPFWQVLAKKGRTAGIEDIYLSRGAWGMDFADGIELVCDKYPDRGPLGGMQAAFEKIKTPYCLVVSVDVPQIPKQVLEHLLSYHQTRMQAGMTAGAMLLWHEDRVEPLIGIYPTGCASLIEEEIKERSCSVFRVLDRIAYETDVQQVKEWQVRSLNTPEAFQKMLCTMKHDFPEKEIKKSMKELENRYEVTLEEALSLVKYWTPKEGKTEELPLTDVNGYILAEDVYAAKDNPPFSRAPVDGYAILSESSKGADAEHPVTLSVKDCVYAGCDVTEIEVQKGEAVRIMTGGEIPKGCDCTIRQEDTDEGEKQVTLYREYKPYDNYCFQGEDYKKGSLLLKKGSKITFAEQGILASLGQTTVKVRKKPIISLFITGDELNPLGTPLSPGKIYDSNGIMVTARIRELGFDLKRVEHVADDGKILAEKLKEAAKDSDIILTTGGVSVGKKDILHEALPLMGAKRIFWKVKIQPGTPTIFSVYESTPILSLSGNPFGAMANVELLLRQILAEFCHDPSLEIKEKQGIMKDTFPKKSKRRRFVRAIYQDGEVRLASGIFSSGAIATLRGCNCLLDIKAGSDPIEPGAQVKVWML